MDDVMVWTNDVGYDVSDDAMGQCMNEEEKNPSTRSSVGL